MKKQPLIFAGVILSVSIVIVTAIILLSGKPGIKRPQEPVKPYPYFYEDVTFENNQAKVTLAGTLTLPSKEGCYPAVILISGSGPQTRDSEFAGHKLFLVLADYLTRNGIAVLRYDDRGFGKSTGDFTTGTSLDFSYDVESAVEYLKTRKEIQKDKIGLIGHSDGAMIAPMVAARSSDVSFIVLLAGPGVEGAKLLVNRQELIERKMGMPENEIKKSRAQAEQIIQIVVSAKDGETAKTLLLEFSKRTYEDIPDHVIPRGMTKDQFISAQIEMFSSPWFKYFLTYDPQSNLQKVKCPVLALNGDKDVQVPSKENLEGIKNALNIGRNQNVTIREMPGLNHAFQESVTGMPEEYSTIEQTISPMALTAMSEWILKRLEN
jgi:pimeloyl-ACP methyl ester carboxylesterase